MDSMEAKATIIEPTLTGSGNAMTEVESAHAVDSSASSEVEEGQAFKTEGAYRILFRTYQTFLNHSSFPLRCNYLSVLNYSVLPGRFSSYR
jgi:hypothetical protein